MGFSVVTARQTAPDFSLETEIAGTDNLHHKWIAGADEVGRGPWAGPVVTAAACLRPSEFPTDLLGQLQDSKKLSAAKRTHIAEALQNLAQQPDPPIHYHICEVSVDELDRINILQASLVGMARSVTDLSQRLGPSLCGALFDGRHCPKPSPQTPLPFPLKPVIKGDSRSYSIAAASILAKTYRDRLMAQWAELYPNYGWHKNAGYGTKQHQVALAQYGVTPLHRRSFKPIHALIHNLSQAQTP